jgi:transposase
VRQQENISITKLAERFKVAKSFVEKLLKRFEETGDISPLAKGGSPPTKLNSEHLVTLVEIIKESNDATLKELTELLESKTGIRVSIAVLKKVRYALCPMPYAHEYLIFLRKAIYRLWEELAIN